MMWLVYGIVSPISKMTIYIGCTSQPLERRLAQHSSDTSSAAYDAIQWIRQCGLEPQIFVLDYFEEMQEALLLETQMILTIKGLVNKQHQAIRDRRMAAYMLERDEIGDMLDGKDVVNVYRRFTDYDDVDDDLVGRPKTPENVEEADRRAKLKAQKAP
jgi:predicted GIY-YIG superfamily endonuclease